MCGGLDRNLLGVWRSDRCVGSALGQRAPRRNWRRLFRGVPILTRTSRTPADVPRTSAASLSPTPGLEPQVPHGYAAAYLPDAQVDLWRPGFRAREQAIRRWLTGAALVRPGGNVFIHADAGDPTVQAFVRWDPIGAARSELRRSGRDRVAARDPGGPGRRVGRRGGSDHHRGGPVADDILGPRPLDDARTCAGVAAGACGPAPGRLACGPWSPS